MKITKEHTDKLVFYLQQFYDCYPTEKYTIFDYVRWMKDRIYKRKKDIWEGVSGDTGGGKSYFKLMCLVLYGKKRSSLTRNITYIPEGDEIEKSFNRLNREILIIDEAAREMRAVNWQSKQQQKVNVKAMTDRFKGNWVSMLMPSFTEFTKSMKRGNMQFRTIILYRTDKYARVILQRKLRNWRAEDPWYDKEADKKYDEAMKKNRGDLTDSQVLSIERSMPNTIMDFIVPDLSLILPDIVAEYERLKADSRKESKKEEAKKEEEKNKHKVAYDELLNRLSKLIINDELEMKDRSKPPTRDEIADFLGISVGRLANAYSSPRLEAPKIPSFRRK